MLICVVIGVVVLAGGYVWLVRSARRASIKRMAGGVDVIKAGIAVQLLRRYKRECPEDTAAKLASAVANELFSDPPSTHDAAVFLEENAQLVQQAIEALQDERETREALTQALRVKAMVAFAEGRRGRQHLIEPIERLRELGLLIPGGDQPSADTFVPLVQRYYSLLKPGA